MAEIVRYNYCSCLGWERKSFEEEIGVFGDRVQYCPWCGTRIMYDRAPALTDKEVRNVRELLKRACL